MTFCPNKSGVSGMHWKGSQKETSALGYEIDSKLVNELKCVCVYVCVRVCRPICDRLIIKLAMRVAS